MFRREIIIYDRKDWPLTVAADTAVWLQSIEGERKLLKARTPWGVRRGLRDMFFLIINAFVNEYNYGLGDHPLDLEW